MSEVSEPLQADAEEETEEEQGPVFVELVDGELHLTDRDELVFRHCAPGHFDKRTGRPTDEMFRATDADAGKMSGARQKKATAEQAYKHRSEVLEKATAGTWAVSVGEIDDAGSRAVDDMALQPSPPPDPAPGHTYIDVRHLSDLTKDERRRFRSTLLIRAVNRSRQFPPGTDS